MGILSSLVILALAIPNVWNIFINIQARCFEPYFPKDSHIYHCKVICLEGRHLLGNQ